jgi:hypothetical protein
LFFNLLFLFSFSNLVYLWKSLKTVKNPNKLILHATNRKTTILSSKYPIAHTDVKGAYLRA